jgi:argininosuccinate lyase
MPDKFSWRKIHMDNKLWGGRFDKPSSAALFEFTSAENASLDAKLLPYDINGSLAHVCMLSKQKMLPKEEAKEILAALLSVKSQAESGKFQLDFKLEDVHTNVEAAVTKITPNGKNMHIARSRNDQISLDTRLYMRDAINEISASLLQLQQSLLTLSKNDCIFSAYTHTQVAQPVSLSFWCHAHYYAIERDLQRLSQLYGTVNQNPLGSGAVAGTTWPIDRNYTSKLLGFDSPTENPMDSVSNRGELEAQLLSCLYLAMAHASRIAEDIILLSSKRLLILPDEYSTGSSMMPQKKNPDPLELIRGKTSRMLGLYVHSAGLLKGVPSGYNLDSQESKYALMSGVDTALASFSILSQLLPLLKFNKEKISLELEEGFACATELADLLSKKGVPFRKSHEITGGIVKDCIAKKKFLPSLSAKEVSTLSGVSISQQELSEAVSIDKVARFSSHYKIPASSPQAKALAERKAKLAEAEKLLQKEVKAITG